MTLHMRNVQKIIIFSMKQFERDVNLIRAAAGIRQYDMGVLCADTQYVNQLQKAIKRNDLAKDGVLAFPYNEKSLYWSSGEMPGPKVQYNLGDIILDIPHLYQKSKEEYLNIYSIMTLMTTRGICQLMGHKDEAHLYEKELEILDSYNRLTRSNLEPLHTPVADIPKQQAYA